MEGARSLILWHVPRRTLHGCMPPEHHPGRVANTTARPPCSAPARNMYGYVQIYIHARMHACECVPMGVHVCTHCKNARAQARSCLHACMSACTYICSHVCLEIHVSVDVYACRSAMCWCDNRQVLYAARMSSDTQAMPISIMCELRSMNPERISNRRR
jgi:hypothetical protein